MNCKNPSCGKEVAENELLTNNDCCPHCRWEHDRDILEGSDLYAEIHTESTQKNKGEAENLF